VSVALAVVSALCFASTHVTAKRGLVDTSIFAGLLVQLATAFSVVLVALVVDPPGTVALGAVAIFAVAGLIAPGAARATALTGVDRLGPAVAVPIQQGARPILTVAGAIVLLNEPVGPVQIIGVLAIAFGGWRLSRERAPAEAGVPAAGPSVTTVRLRRTFKPGIVFPLITAVCYATSDIVVKKALGSFPYPTLGTLVGIGAALLVWSTACATMPRLRRSLRFGPSLGWFVASGAFMGLAILLMFHALQEGEVSVVGPIIAAQTLAVFLLSAILLRRVEHVTGEIVMAGIAVVIGTILVTS
jgi:drug/metabolite transporter (DMT)-like permease